MSKKVLSVILVFALVLCISACKKSESTPYKCTTCSNTPKAAAANDHAATGIYKGVVVGSSGIITFDLFNTTSTMTAVMILDSQAVNLTSTSTYVQGQPISAVFTGTMNGSPVTINFSCDAYGGNISVTASITGHPGAIILVMKELSTALIQCFQGSISGSSSSYNGVFNLVLNTSTGTWGGEYNIPITGPSTTGGASTSSGVNCTGCLGAPSSNINGTLSGDYVSGTWNDGMGDTGMWSGTRTL
ncbi:MAG: hypothetical protein JWO03_3401 [Bacteroidetes bacterium]|nr:hypothetical protein [Bacteroidota bacterium]